MATTTNSNVGKSSKDPSPETVMETIQESTLSKTHGRSMSTGSSDSGYSADPAKSTNSNKPTSSTVSKTTTVAWSNQMAWKPNRPVVTQSVGASTSAVTTCVSSGHSNGLTNSSPAMTSARTVDVSCDELRTSSKSDVKVSKFALSRMLTDFLPRISEFRIFCYAVLASIAEKTKKTDILLFLDSSIFTGSSGYNRICIMTLRLIQRTKEYETCLFSSSWFENV